MNVTSLIATVRRIVDEPNERIWSDADLLSYLNRSGERLHLRMIETDLNIGLDNDLLSNLGTTTLTAIGSSLRFESGILPSYVQSIKRIEDLEDPTLPREIFPRGINNQRSWTTVGKEWDFTGDRRIAIYAPSAPTASQIRVFFYRRFAPLVRFRVQNGAILVNGVVRVSLGLDELAANGGLGTFEKTAGIYRGAQFYMNDSLSDGSYQRPAGYRGVVTNWASFLEDVATPIYQFTVSPDPSVLPVGASVVGSTGPQFDDQFDELLCYEAAMRASDKESNANAKAYFAQTAADLWQQFISSQQSRQTQQPRFVNYIPRDAWIGRL